MWPAAAERPLPASSWRLQCRSTAAMMSRSSRPVPGHKAAAVAAERPLACDIPRGSPIPSGNATVRWFPRAWQPRTVSARNRVRALVPFFTKTRSRCLSTTHNRDEHTATSRSKLLAILISKIVGNSPGCQQRDGVTKNMDVMAGPDYTLRNTFVKSPPAEPEIAVSDVGIPGLHDRTPNSSNLACHTPRRWRHGSPTIKSPAAENHGISTGMRTWRNCAGEKMPSPHHRADRLPTHAFSEAEMAEKRFWATLLAQEWQHTIQK